MDKSKCPDCGNPVRPIPTSAGVGYYCENEDKFIGEYFDGPTEEELDRKLKREALMLYAVVSIPFFLFLGVIIYQIFKLL